MQDSERSEDLNPAHRELEEALKGLAPAPVSISRDRLMFQAGAVLGRRTANRWRNATAALVLVNVGLVGLSIRSPREVGHVQVAQAPSVSPQNAETRNVRDESPADSSAAPWTKSRDLSEISSAKSAGAYVLLRDDVLRRGLSALPTSSTPTRAEKPVTVEQLLQTAPRSREPASPWGSFATPIRSFLFSGETL